MQKQTARVCPCNTCKNCVNDSEQKQQIFAYVNDIFTISHHFLPNGFDGEGTGTDMYPINGCKSDCHWFFPARRGAYILKCDRTTK